MYHCLPLAFQLTCNYSAVWWGRCERGPIRRAGSETFPLCARQCTWHVKHKQPCKQQEESLLLACFWNALCSIHNEFPTMNSHSSTVRWKCGAFGVLFVAFKDKANCVQHLFIPGCFCNAAPASEQTDFADSSITSSCQSPVCTERLKSYKSVSSEIQSFCQL